MGEFKCTDYMINVSDDKIDNAQYILMAILDKYKINIHEIESLSQIHKTMLQKLFNTEHGILIGQLSNMYGVFNFYLNGIPKIYTQQGIIIKKANEFKKYLLGTEDIKTLYFESKSYIKIINTNHPENYYGVFYSLKDAIKVCSENDLVKCGEITS